MQLQQQQAAKERQEAEEDRIREMIQADTFLSQKQKLAEAKERATWRHKFWSRVNDIIGEEIVELSDESETDSDEDDTGEDGSVGISSSSSAGKSLTSPITPMHQDRLFIVIRR